MALPVKGDKLTMVFSNSSGVTAAVALPASNRGGVKLSLLRFILLYGAVIVMGKFIPRTYVEGGRGGGGRHSNVRIHRSTKVCASVVGSLAPAQYLDQRSTNHCSSVCSATAVDAYSCLHKCVIHVVFIADHSPE